MDKRKLENEIEKDFSLSSAEKKFCVNLAKRSIEHSLKNEGLLKLSPLELKKLPRKLCEEKACFVTLTIDEKLRGCIGHLIAVKPLYRDIIENAYAAAFSDSRFNPLKEKEFENVSIEVSVLTDPEGLYYGNANDLLKKIIVGKDGIIIQKGAKSATFLPSVWDDISSKEEFLSELCLKAGLMATEWQKPGLKVERYYTIKAK
ncbi:MAG: AmmeMemoRadiSam system protein A [archaeon]|jgi:AmmeMemoRadiSam system protein A